MTKISPRVCPSFLVCTFDEKNTKGSVLYQNVPCAMLIGGLSVNINHLKTWPLPCSSESMKIYIIIVDFLLRYSFLSWYCQIYLQCGQFYNVTPVKILIWLQSMLTLTFILYVFCSSDIPLKHWKFYNNNICSSCEQLLRNRYRTPVSINCRGLSWLLQELLNVAEYYFFWTGSTCLTRRLMILPTATCMLYSATQSGVLGVLNG